MSLYNTDYDTWLMRCRESDDGQDSLRELAIERIMNEHELDWDDAESYFEDQMFTWEQKSFMDKIASEIEESYI